MSISRRIRNLAMVPSKYLSRYNLNDYIREISSERNLGDVLFVGSGGALDELCRTFEHDSFVTIDIDPARNPDHVMDLTKLAFEEGRFDTVFALEVLEHVKEPGRAVEEISRVLRADGKAIISTPFLYPIHEAPHDYFRFTKYGLRHLFRGFREDFFTERTGYFWTIAILVSRLNKSKKMRHNIVGLVMTLVALALLPLILLLDRFMPATVTAGYVAKYVKIADDARYGPDG